MEGAFKYKKFKADFSNYAGAQASAQFYAEIVAKSIHVLTNTPKKPFIILMLFGGRSAVLYSWAVFLR